MHSLVAHTLAVALDVCVITGDPKSQVTAVVPVDCETRTPGRPE